jgi:hypothetical protein
MLKISIARRLTANWLSAAELVRETYARTYAAEVMPDPDCFIVGHQGAALASCAGIAYADGGPLFSERYLDRPVEQELERRFGVGVDRGRVIEVGALAGSGRGAGQAMIRITPVIAWTLGMEYILCTATSGLRVALQRSGIAFTPFGAADAAGLTPDELQAWGSYYRQQPMVGVISLRGLSPLFAEATGKYAFLDPEVTLLGDGSVLQEATHHA